MAQTAEKKRAIRRLHKSLGLCTECGEKAIEGRSLCERHAAKISKHNAVSRKRVRDEKRSDGICQYIGCHSEAIPGACLCGYHHERYSEWRDKSRRKNLSEGKCQCGRVPADGKKSCQKCLDSRRASNKRRYAALLSAGKCVYCAKADAAEGQSKCENCASKLKMRRK